MKFNVFISYSTHDLQQVEALKNQMANTPISIFVAEHSVDPGEELGPKISRAISDCDLFIVLWSKNAKNSDWVSQEIGKATALNKKILPLVLDDSMNLPGFISGIKYIPVYENIEEALEKAQRIAEAEYNKKLDEQLSQDEEKKQKNKQAIIAMGLGALFLWSINQS